MTVRGSGPEYIAYIRKFRTDHPSPLWKQCPTCWQWYYSKNKPKPGSRCAQCPAKPEAPMPQKRGY